MEILKNLESKIYPVETIVESLKKKNKKEKNEFVYRIKSYKGGNFRGVPFEALSPKKIFL